MVRKYYIKERNGENVYMLAEIGEKNEMLLNLNDTYVSIANNIYTLYEEGNPVGEYKTLKDALETMKIMAVHIVGKTK